MWPTPTPIPISTPAFNIPIDPTEIGNNFSNWLLQGWQFFDSNPIATLIFFGLVVLVIYFGLSSIKAHLESL